MRKSFFLFIIVMFLCVPFSFTSATTIFSQPEVTTITAQVGPTIINTTQNTNTVIGSIPIVPEVVFSPTSISFSGTFFSSANVVVLQDGQEFLSGIAESNGKFFLLKTGLTPGVYTFSVFVELPSGRRVLIETFHVTVPFGAYVKIENIRISRVIWDILFPKNVVVNLKNYCTTVIADLNCDERVDLIDLSILEYWYRSGKYSVGKDLNNDKKIDLGDFSVMAYYWTG